VPLTPGTRLGVYEVTAQIGAGGMGEVYRATDIKLKRQVAIKILPAALAADPDRLARFQREAEVLASLNHPQIAGIYGLEEGGGITALVMERVEGEDLSQRIARGAIPLDEALPIAKQIGEALEAAHELGIIHRDLKPANIKVREDGTVKVLDFGLAKALDPVGSGADAAALTNSPTITSPAAMTRMGVILGTAAYMPPEQAKGRAVDKRADIWAFGCVVFEMLTGTRAFAGDDVSETLAAVLRAEPEWKALPAETPAPIRKLLRRCLEKDARRRLQAIGDARLEIEDALAGTAEGQPMAAAPARAHRRERLAWAVASLLLVVLVASIAIGRVAYLGRAPASADMRATRFTLTPPDGWSLALGATPSGGSIAPLAVSPDGRHVAFVAQSREGKSQLWVRSFDTLTARALPGTDDAASPFWSPDSRVLGFFTQGKLKKIDVSGGSSIVLCDVSTPLGGTWGSDGVIVFAPSGSTGLQKVSAAGGAPTAATALGPGETYHMRPTFLPDGRHFIYVARNTGAVYIASLDSTERTRVLERIEGTNVLYAQGHLLFVRGTRLVAEPFDADRRVVTGEAVPVAEEIATSATPYGQFSASANGVLVYQTGASLSRTQLVWFDRAGQQTAVLGEPAVYGDVRLSPDGKRAVVSVADPARTTGDLWVFDVARGLRTRFTFDPADDSYPIWSPDGSRIVFSSNRKGPFDLYEKASNGAGAEQLVLSDSVAKNAYSWSPDGRFIAYQSNAGTGSGNDVWVLPLGGDRKPFVVVQTPFNETRGVFSPDGHWLAHQSTESGRFEVYVVPFPGPGGKWQVSTAGGTEPRWGRDGKELFSLDARNTLTAAAVKGDGASFEVGAVQALFQTRARAGLGSPYDVSADGQRFLINTLPALADAPPFTVVFNWTAGLKK
jgi:Tol biopolymer transport system component